MRREEAEDAEVQEGDARRMSSDDGGVLRVGVLGAGPIAQFAHLPACRKARNAELYALCDVAEDLLERVAAQHRPSHIYTRYEDMLANPEVDAVVVATADEFHVPSALQALDAGKHVLVEKPLGVTVEEGEVLRDRVEQAGLVLQVGTMRRFDPAIEFARAFIEEELGQVIAFKAWYCDSVYRYTMTDALQSVVDTSDTAHKPSQDPRRDKERYYLLAHGSHLIDLACYLVGDIVQVSARMVHRSDAYCWFVACEFADGSIGHLDLTVSVRMDWHEGFHVYGEHGSIVAKSLLPWYLRSSEVECFSVKDGCYRRPLGEDGDFYRRQIEGFAATVLDGEPQRGADVLDGLSSLRVIEGIRRSVAGQGGFIDVGSNPKTL